MSGGVAEALVAKMMARGRVQIDAIVAADAREAVGEQREWLTCWRSVRLFQLHGELLAEVDRFMRFEMTDAKAVGHIVTFEPRGEYVIAVDDLGQRFITPAGRFDWRPLGPPQPEPPKRWRRLVAA
jgi:hypothetical protein